MSDAQLQHIDQDADDRRLHGRGDRRILDRDDRGRRSGDTELTDSGLPPAASPMEAVAQHPWTYTVIAGILLIIALTIVVIANYNLAPLIYSESAKAKVAEAFVGGWNYATFDLNVDTRGIRREHVRRMRTTPDVIILGASHMQEVPADTFPNAHFYNGHVHRDYYEDLLAMSELLIVYGRLPKTLVMSIRSRTFEPVANRTDFLWLPFMPEYRAMARRLGIPSHSRLETFNSSYWLGLLSLPSLIENGLRTASADIQVGPTTRPSLRNMDVLSHDGTIRWSWEHQRFFTQSYTNDMVEDALQHAKAAPPIIDPTAVDAVDRLLELLRTHGVRIVLLHPPYNPDFYDGIAGTEYKESLRRVAETTLQLAEKHGAAVVGSFDPADVGCIRTMYIDSEHSDPQCLRRLFAEIPSEFRDFGRKSGSTMRPTATLDRDQPIER